MYISRSIFRIYYCKCRCIAIRILLQESSPCMFYRREKFLINFNQLVNWSAKYILNKITYPCSRLSRTCWRKIFSCWLILEERWFTVSGFHWFEFPPYKRAYIVVLFLWYRVQFHRVHRLDRCAVQTQLKYRVQYLMILYFHLLSVRISAVCKNSAIIRYIPIRLCV